jgi:hypothetical protein
MFVRLELLEKSTTEQLVIRQDKIIGVMRLIRLLLYFFYLTKINNYTFS